MSVEIQTPVRSASRRVRDVVFVDGVRTPFGRAGEKGMYWGTRADDLVVKAMKGLLDIFAYDRTLVPGCTP